MLQFVQVRDIAAIVPEMELAVFGMFLLIFDLLIEKKRRLGYIALAGIAISGFFLFQRWNVEFYAYGGALSLDPLAMFFKVIFLIAAALSIAISLKYLDIERENHTVCAQFAHPVLHLSWMRDRDAADNDAARTRGQ